MSMDKLVFVIPTYNTYEKYDAQRKPKGRKITFRKRTNSNVAQVLDALISSIRKNRDHEPEVIVVNDGCTDETKGELIDLLEKRGFRRIYDKNQRIIFFIEYHTLF